MEEQKNESTAVADGGSNTTVQQSDNTAHTTVADTAATPSAAPTTTGPPASSSPAAVPDPVHPTQMETDLPLQTPPTTAPREELGTSAPARKPRQPRKPVAPKKVVTHAVEETKSEQRPVVIGKNAVDADEGLELIDTSSNPRILPKRELGGVGGEQINKQPANTEEPPKIDDRLKEQRTSNGAQYLASSSIFGRNAAAKSAYERVREKMLERTGGWSRGRFK